jgi:PAS domain S-box-containing protein
MTNGRTPENVRSDTLERVSDGVVAFDADLRYTYVNERAETLLGRDRERLLGAHIWDAFPDAEGTRVESSIETAIADQRTVAFERYNAELQRWFEVDVYPDDDGVTLLFSDVTEQKERTLEFERLNRQLNALVENTSEAIYIKDTTGRYQLLNQAAADFFGLDAEAAVGSFDSDLFDEESAVEIAERDAHVVETGEAISEEVVHFISGERYVFLDNRYPYRDESGDVVGVMGISRDITERKRREQELRKLNEEYEAVFENAEDAIFLMNVDAPDSDSTDGESGGDVEFRFERLNPSHEAKSGMSTDVIRGKTPREALGEETGEEVEANYRRCYETREPVTYTEELPMPERDVIWQTKLAPVVVDGEVTRIVGIARDVTDSVEQERELRRQNERLEEFASVISHDLRNPLNVAQGRAALLEEECESDHVPPLVRSLDRMESIIEDTLTLARKGDAVTDPDEISLADLTRQSWKMVDTAEATLRCEDDVTVRGDRNRLQHVFENLFRNAVEHGGEDVTVRVGRFGPGGIYVEDDGQGVPEAKRDAVFEPGHSSTTGGTGFGLTIVKRMAEAHGWDVAMTAGDDGGARVEFTGVGVVS